MGHKREEGIHVNWHWQKDKIKDSFRHKEG
jgi:hypothetical protein